MFKRARILILNNPHSLRICKELAREIGLKESIVLLQLEFLISISTNERDSRMWTYQSTRDLQANYFPWWSVMTINRAVKSLEAKNLIIIGNYNQHKYDKTRWFALNLDVVDLLLSVTVKTPGCGTRSSQIGTGSDQIDTTIPETTTENTLDTDLLPQPKSAAVTNYQSTRPELEYGDPEEDNKPHPKWSIPELPIHFGVLRACRAKKFARTRLKSALNGYHKQIIAFEALAALSGMHHALTTCIGVAMDEIDQPRLMPQSWIDYRLEHAMTHHWSVQGTIKALGATDAMIKHCKYNLRKLSPEITLAREGVQVEELGT